MTTFRLTNLSVRHQANSDAARHALSDISLTVWPGEQLAIIGPSGAGKTTLLHTLACAHRPESGEFNAFGVSPWKISNPDRHKLRTKFFLAPQSPPLPSRQRVVTTVLAALLPQWTIWQAIASLIKPADPHAVFEVLKRLKLEDKLYSRVDRLSGGERQRCGIARLLMSKAEAFLVDEPLSALDPTLALQTLSVIQKEAKTRQATLICSLHHVELARAHFPRIVGLREGKIIFDARREQVTDDMVAALYQNADHVPQNISSDVEHPDADLRCF